MRAIPMVVALLVSACGDEVRGGDASGGDDAGTATDDAGPAVAAEPCSERDARDPAPEVFVGPTGLRERFVELFSEARETLRVEVYQLVDAPLVDAMLAAHGRGVELRVMLDGDQRVNGDARERLEAAGVAVRDGPSGFRHFHPKVVVVDERRAVVTSANLNEFSMESERNHGVVLDDAHDVADLVALFDHDWNDTEGAPPVLDCTRLVLSPDNGRQRIERVLAGAETELRLQHLSFSDEEMRFVLGVRARDGVRVRVMLADPTWIDTNAEAAAALAASGVEVRYLTFLENHAKLVTADNGAAFVGSQNFSYTSLELNREVGVVLTDDAAVRTLNDAFDADWDRGTAP